MRPSTFVLVACTLLAGCRAKQTPQPADKTHIQNLARAYQMCSVRGEGPADEAAFKAAIQKLPAAQAEKLGLANVESAFTSPRDNKPYHVVYGVGQGTKGGPGPPVIIHEQDGKDGKRHVAFVTTQVEEVDDARFRQIAPKAP